MKLILIALVVAGVGFFTHLFFLILQALIYK